MCKTAEPIEMPFGMWTRVGARKHVLDGVHSGATWRILLNRPCVVAMRPFRQITMSTCCMLSWCEVELRCCVLQSCFVVFFNDAHNDERVFNFIRNMRASVEVRHVTFRLLLQLSCQQYTALHSRHQTVCLNGCFPSEPGLRGSLHKLSSSACSGISVFGGTDISVGQMPFQLVPSQACHSTERNSAQFMFFYPVVSILITAQLIITVTLNTNVTES